MTWGWLDSRRLRWLIWAAIMCAGWAAYANTFHGPFVFDDDTSIVLNDAIRPPLDLGRIWSFQPARFFGNLSFALNYRFGQLRVEGYHAVNLAVHLAAGLTIYWLCMLLFSTLALRDAGLSARQRIWLAFFGALVFVTHPVQTQAVTYVTQRLASLAALFYLVSVSCFVAFRSSASAKKWMWLGLSALSGIAALLTKENAFSLPVMILLLEIFFFRSRQASRKRIVLILSALAMVAGLAAALNLLPRETAAISRQQYLFTQFRVMLTYLRLLVVPVGQTIDYDYPVYASFFAPAVLAGFAAVAGLLAAAIALAKRHPLLSFGILWFFTALSVESSLVPISDVIFEHRLYLPLAGFAMSLVGTCVSLGSRVRPRLIVTIAAAVVVCFGLSTWMRNEVWRSKYRILNDNVAKAPRKARPVDYRGTFWESIGWWQMAGADYSRAIALDRTYWKAFYHRGSLLARQARYRDAIADLDAAITLAPGYAPSRVNKGNALLAVGRADSALLCYDAALALDPASAAAYGNRGLARFGRGERERALDDYGRALALDSSLHYVRLDRGQALNAMGRYGGALADFDRYLSAAPSSGDALIGRAWTLYKLGRYGESRRDVEHALALHAAVPREYREMIASYGMLKQKPLAFPREGKVRGRGTARAVWPGLFAYLLSVLSPILKPMPFSSGP